MEFQRDEVFACSKPCVQGFGIIFNALSLLEPIQSSKYPLYEVRSVLGVIILKVYVKCVTYHIYYMKQRAKK